MSKLLVARGFALSLLVAIGASGCAADASGDGDPAADADEGEVGKVDEQLLAGRHLSAHEVASVLRGAGFPSSVIPEMVCTAKYESSFYERASNRNSNGSVDRGLFQINSLHLGDGGCPSRANAGALYNASTNARCAYQVWRSQGLNAWYGYQSHRAECNAYRL